MRHACMVPAGRAEVLHSWQLWLKPKVRNAHGQYGKIEMARSPGSSGRAIRREVRSSSRRQAAHLLCMPPRTTVYPNHLRGPLAGSPEYQLALSTLAVSNKRLCVSPSCDSELARTSTPRAITRHGQRHGGHDSLTHNMHTGMHETSGSAVMAVLREQ